MEQNIPRRLARFNRNQNQNLPQENYNDNQFQAPPQGRFDQNQKEENFELSQNKKIPSMDYDDVNLEADRKNLEELKKIQEKNLVEKLALNEVEKFKVQNKRMPNSKEEEQIAETLYTQLKNDSLNTQTNNSQGNLRGRNKRRNEASNVGQGFGEVPTQEENNSTDPQEITQNSNSQVTNIKDLFEDDESASQVKGREKDEFDMDIGEVSELDSIENKAEEELNQTEDEGDEKFSNCPNCKKSTEKVIYCPKCGAAFCVHCAKTQGNDKNCPKCGTKIKL